jgi:two-component system chemotaxis response regulator CheB
MNMQRDSSTPRPGLPKLLVIGGSAGSIEALNHILPALPARFPLPVLIVVHLPPERDCALASIFSDKCFLRVKEAEDKERFEPGVIYLAPPDYHLLVENSGTLALSSDEPELFCRPSINVLFESAADAFGSDVVALILSGANSDGANGLKAICEAGGKALIQAPGTANSTAMPEAAAKMCPDALILEPEKMAGKLIEFTETAAK